MPIRVAVEPYDPKWAGMFIEESRRIGQALGSNAVAVHHIGSTSVPGLYAKPIIDILVEVASIADVDSRNPAMEALGYEVKGEFGIPGRRYFRREDDSEIRTHHVHSFETGCPEIERHLTFRDFLFEHPTWAERYSALKRHLVEVHPQDMEAYMDGKDAFIREVDRLAASWRAAGRRGNDNPHLI